MTEEVASGTTADPEPKPHPTMVNAPDPQPAAPASPLAPEKKKEKEEKEDEREPRISGDEWTRPRRIALIVAFALSLALFFGTAAALLKIPNALPVAALLALVGGMAEIPPLVLYVAGFERRCIALAPLLLLSVGCGLESYFVGGTIGVGSPSTLGAAGIAIVLYLMVGHRARESPRRRVRRVRRWARNAAVLGAVLLLVALGLYSSYVNTAPLPSIAAGTLQENMALFAGQHVVAGGGSVNGAAGDLLFVLLASSEPQFTVNGALVNSGGVSVANVTAGNFSSPAVVYLELRVDPGVYTLVLSYPSQPGGPSQEEVRWTLGDIPAGVQAETGAALSAGWVGFALLIVGITLWIVARPPDEPTSAPPPGGEEGSPATSPATSPEAAPASSEPSAPEPEGATPIPVESTPSSSAPSSSGTTGVSGETSDKERT